MFILYITSIIRKYIKIDKIVFCRKFADALCLLERLSNRVPYIEVKQKGPFYLPRDYLPIS